MLNNSKFAALLDAAHTVASSCAQRLSSPRASSNDVETNFSSKAKRASRPKLKHIAKNQRYTTYVTVPHDDLEALSQALATIQEKLQREQYKNMVLNIHLEEARNTSKYWMNCFVATVGNEPLQMCAALAI